MAHRRVKIPMENGMRKCEGEICVEPPSKALWEAMLTRDPEGVLACACSALSAVGEEEAEGNEPSFRAEAVEMARAAVANIHDFARGGPLAARLLVLALRGRLDEASKFAKLLQRATAMVHEHPEKSLATSALAELGAERALALEKAAPGFLGGKERSMSYCLHLPELAAAMRKGGDLSDQEALGFLQRVGDGISTRDQKAFFSVVQNMDQGFMQAAWRAFWERGGQSSGEYGERSWMASSCDPNPWAALETHGGLLEVEPRLALSMMHVDGELFAARGATEGFLRYAMQWGEDGRFAEAMEAVSRSIEFEDETNRSLAVLEPANLSARILCAASSVANFDSVFQRIGVILEGLGADSPRFTIIAPSLDMKGGTVVAGEQDQDAAGWGLSGEVSAAGIMAVIGFPQNDVAGREWLMAGATEGDVAMANKIAETYERLDGCAQELACAQWVQMALSTPATASLGLPTKDKQRSRL